MKELVKKYFDQGYNCCQCIIMAGNEKYQLNIDTDCIRATSCVNGGMGIGSMCCAIIGGVMIIGCVFEKDHQPPEHSKLDHIRMKFIDEINQEFKSVNCCCISKLPIANKNCEKVIEIIADILDKVILGFLDVSN